MSCYKTLAIENEDLKTQLLLTLEDIERLKEALAAEPDWVNAQDVIRQLDSLDLQTPAY